MRDRLPCFHLAPALPPLEELVRYLRTNRKPTVASLMAAADQEGRTLIQPRIGVGGQQEMMKMLRTIHAQARPDVLTLTIDSHTRLGFFAKAAEVLAADASQLNGYPLVAHGYVRAREIDASFVDVPLQVRHGSPDGRRLFAESIAGGLTSFEGGGIGYNIPYCKNVALANSLSWWQEVDEAVGMLAEAGVLVEREMFGSLTGVLVPPSIALSCVLLEAILATRAGCRSVSLSLPQGGNIVQDVAALRTARRLCLEYLPATASAHVVLHQFMGVFPQDRARADALIFTGGLVARLGNATKVITKTYQEALGRPDSDANSAGVCLTRAAILNRFAFQPVDPSRLAEEEEQILVQVRQIVEPILGAPALQQAIVSAFESGRLDVPFPANSVSHGNVIPARDAAGAIRFARTGALPFSEPVRLAACRGVNDPSENARLSACLRDSVLYFT